jgi:hypothetical protein
MDFQWSTEELSTSIALLQQGASPSEYDNLQEALDILRGCASCSPPQHDEKFILQELEEQLRWTELYHDQKRQLYGAKPLRAESIVPEVQDNEALLYRFSVLVLEGASALSDMLGVVKKNNHWELVMHKQRDKKNDSEQEYDDADGDDSEPASPSQLSQTPEHEEQVGSNLQDNRYWYI